MARIKIPTRIPMAILVDFFNERLVLKDRIYNSKQFHDSL